MELHCGSTRPLSSVSYLIFIPYYVCQGRHIRIRAVRGQECPARFIPATQLDELVWQDLCAVLTEPALIAKALNRMPY